jgi:hypothetical protein
VKAELMIYGPKGQTFASIEVGSDGVTIYPAMADAALACALNSYNELPTPYRAIAFGKHEDYDFMVGDVWPPGTVVTIRKPQRLVS